MDLAARVEAARQRWNAGDLPGYLSLYDAAIKLHGYTPEPMGKQAVAGFYQMVWATMAAEGKPNPTLTFHEVLTDGVLYSCRFTMAGVHKGPFMGVPATGKPYVLAGDRKAVRACRYHHHALCRRHGRRALVERRHARRAGADRRHTAARLAIRRRSSSGSCRRRR